VRPAPISRRGAGERMARAVDRRGRGSWGGRRPSLGDYVTGTEAMDRVTAAGGRSCYLSSVRRGSRRGLATMIHGRTACEHIASRSGPVLSPRWRRGR
jgi:hypothetical protein